MSRTRASNRGRARIALPLGAATVLAVASAFAGSTAAIAVEEHRFCVTVRSEEPIDGDLLAAVESGEASLIIEEAAACAEPAPFPDATPLVIVLGSSVTGTAAELLDLLDVEIEEPDGYDRDLFDHWIDEDGDGCHARNEVLISESITTVTVGSGCFLSGGTWFSAFDGQQSSLTSDFDVDHFVPLAEAWRSGARDWTEDRRTRFANDLGDDRALIAVSDDSNSAKSDKDPAEWLPPEPGFHCRYASDWVAVKTRWDLAVDEVEQDAIAGVLADCPDEHLVVEVA